MDRLEEWRVFVSVAGLRSFTKAARSLGKSPQAATRAISALEERVGKKLLHRTTRSVSLTYEGERYIERARRAITELELLEGGDVEDDSAKKSSDDDGGGLRGVVSMTAPVLFGQLHVVPVLTELLSKHPLLDARLLLLDRVVSLAEEGIDVAVRIGTLPDSSLRARFVGYVRSVVVASPKYFERTGKSAPRDPQSLAEHACISFAATTPIADHWAFRRADDPKAKRDLHVSVRPRLVVNSGQAAIDVALSGLGIVRVISYQVDALVAKGSLKVLLRPFEPAPIPVHLVQLAGARNRAALSFMELAAERLKSKLA